MIPSNDPTPGSRLRSAQWYAGDDRNAYIHRAWMRRGVPGDAFTGRPHIAIANTASDRAPCNAHLTEVAASVKNGVYEAGGIPLELPVVSPGKTLLRPTAMLWRNMTASTMALVAEALGTVVPGVAGTPAADSRLLEAAHGSGRLVVEMVAADRRPSTFLTHASFANAIVTMAAVGGSTNAVVHLLAIAGRLGIDLTLDDFDRLAHTSRCSSTCSPRAGS